MFSQRLTPSSVRITCTCCVAELIHFWIIIYCYNQNFSKDIKFSLHAAPHVSSHHTFRSDSQSLPSKNLLQPTRRWRPVPKSIIIIKHNHKMRSMCAVIGHSELRTVYTSLPTIIRVTVKALRFSLLFYQFYVRGSYSLLAARCVIHLGCGLIAQMFFFGKYIQPN